MVSLFVIDDSAFFRKALRHALSFDPAIQIIGEAESGKEALEKLAQLKPDLVTLDVQMPDMNGLTCLRKILQQYPGLPVIMLSALTQEGAYETLEALSLGAVDFIDKKSFNLLDLDLLSYELLDKIRIWKAGERGAVIEFNSRKPLNASEPAVVDKKRDSMLPKIDWKHYSVCIIGASTGGPSAVQSILQGLREDFPLPILIAQHMPEGFTKTFADRLNGLCPLKVVEAENGMPIERGTILIAPGGRNMEISNNRTVSLSSNSANQRYVPNVDLLMSSATDVYGKQVIGVLLTGMGNDGAKGLLKIHQANGLTIGQNEASSVIYGMPKVAHEAGAVRYQLAIDDIVTLFQQPK